MLDRKRITLLTLPALLAMSACSTQGAVAPDAPAAADRPSPYEARAAAEAEEREQNRRDEEETSNPPD